jgi:hypothetical protein
LKSFQRIAFPGQPTEHDGKLGPHTWAQLDRLAAKPQAQSTMSTGLAIKGDGGSPPTGSPQATPGSIKVKWAGGLNKSLRNLIRFKVTEAAADKIVVDLLADPSAYYTAADGQRVARSDFESTAQKDGAFVLMEGMVSLLMAKSGLTRAAVEESGRDEEKFGALSDTADRWRFFGANEGRSPSAKQEARERGRDRDKGKKVEGDVTVLAAPPMAALYIRLLGEYGGVAIPDDLTKKAAQSGLSPQDVERLVGASRSAAAITGLFTQAAKDGPPALGAPPADLANSAQFSAVVTTMLEQFTWGNATVARNEVRLRASGVPEGAPGLVFVDGTLYYDAQGNPLRSFAGEGFRDPCFQGAPRKNAWYNLIDLDAIADPEVREFFRLLKHQIGDSTALMVRGAEALYENFGPVRDLVLEGLDAETRQQLGDALKTIAFFLVAKAAITAAERSSVPALQIVGATADGLLAAGQLLLDIDFVGSTVAMLLGAGYHLCRVHKDDNGDYTLTSKFEMRAAADIIRQMLAMVIAQAFIKEGLNKTEAGYKKVRDKLSRTASGEATRLGCNVCILEVAPSRWAEQDMRVLYEDAVTRKAQSGKGETKPLERGQPYEPPDYRGVVIHPNGNTFGPYDKLGNMLRAAKLTGKQRKEGQGYSVHAHHILEHTIAQKFGVSRDSGRCVAIESDDHLRFSRYMSERRSFREINDIWEAYHAHREMYQDLGNKELLPELDRSITEQKAAILKSYESGRVEGRPRKGEKGWEQRLAVARDFLKNF